MGADEQAERRAHQRTSIGLDVLCTAGREEGPAILRDLSPFGALLEPASVRPAIGEPVTIWLRAELDDEPDSLLSDVVRLSPDGFAVEFRAPYSVVHHILAKYHRATDAPSGGWAE